MVLSVHWPPTTSTLLTAVAHSVRLPAAALGFRSQSMSESIELPTVEPAAPTIRTHALLVCAFVMVKPWMIVESGIVPSCAEMMTVWSLPTASGVASRAERMVGLPMPTRRTPSRTMLTVSSYTPGRTRTMYGFAALAAAGTASRAS